MKLVAAVILVMTLSGCTTLEQRLGRRIGCDPKKLVVNEQIHAPGYEQYKMTCSGKKYVCRDAPFYSSCNPDDGGRK